VTITTRALAWLAVGVAALASAAPACQACSIPVFRYALERWPAEPYEAVVLHRGPLGPAEQAALDALRKTTEGNAALTNLQVRTVDLEGPDGKQSEPLLKGGDAGALPRLIVRYPDSLRVEEHAWAGALTTANVQALVDSPTRREIVRRLAGGDCAVWLLIESGDRAQDDAAARLLREQLRKLEGVLELPPQTDAEGPGDEPPPEPKGEAEGGESALPKLKVAFSSLRVSQTDPAEKLFLDTLLGLDPELRKEGKPIALAVFGQGRALPALLGDGINAENITDVCAFVVGPCSCQVKAMNPGWDVLMTADWFGALDGQIVKDPEPPALTGSVAAALPKAGPADTSAGAAAKAVVATPTGGLLLRNILLAAAAGVAILAAASFAVLRRGGAPREPR